MRPPGAGGAGRGPWALAAVALAISTVFNGFAPRLLSLRGGQLEPVLPFSHAPMSVIGADFAGPYTFANNLLAGLDPYELHPELGSRYTDPFLWRGRPRFLYPPPLLLLFLPFAPFEYVTAYRLWIGLQLLLLALATAALARLLAGRDARLLFAATVAQLFAFSPDFWFYLERGQADLALVLITSLSLVAVVRHRAAVGAVLASLAALLKPYPSVVLVIYAVRRQWRALISAGVVAAIGLALSFLVLPRWLSVMAEASADPELLSRGDASVALNGAIQDAFLPTQPVMRLLVALDDRLSADLLLLPGENTGLFGGYQINALAYYVSLAAGAALLGALAWHTWRLGRAEAGPGQARLHHLFLYSLGAAIMVLIPTISWSYRTIWALFFLLLSFALCEQRRVPWPHFVLLSVLPALLLAYWPPGWGRTLVAVPLLLCLLAAEVQGGGRSAARYLTAVLFAAALAALPVGKAWLVAALTLYYAVTLPRLLAAGAIVRRVELA